MKASESRKIDRIIVIATAVLGLLLGVWAILKALGFNDQFKPPAARSETRGRELLDAAKAQVEETRKAKETIANPAPAEWKTASAAGRERGFLVSTGLVFRRGADEASDTIIDLDKEQPRLREPFPNAYFQKYSLDLQYANVGDLDPDKDFFTTREEYEYSQKLGKEFSPVDPKSCPPLHFLLRYVNFEEVPYKLKLSSVSPPSFGLRYEADKREDRWSDSAEMAEDANGNGQLDEGEDRNFNNQLDGAVAAGKKGDEGRFVVKSYKTVKEMDGGLEVERVIASIEDTTRPKDHPQRIFELKEGETVNLPSRAATFDYLPTPGRTILKKEFDKFTLPDTLAPSYLVLALDNEKVVLQYDEGGPKQLTLRKGEPPVP